MSTQPAIPLQSVQKTVPVKAAHKAKAFDWIYYGVFAGCLVPLSEMLFGLASGSINLGRELSLIINQLGYIGLALLLASLACTPLRLLFGFTWPARLRKLLGLLGFFYICLHVLVYVGLDQGFDVIGVFRQAITHYFLFFGMVAFLLLIPLAATSTKGMIKRLGGKRWQKLHHMAYRVGVLGVVHFYLRIKGQDHTEPIVCGIILLFLLGVRWYKSRQKAKP